MLSIGFKVEDAKRALAESSRALSSAFYWDGTEQRHDFWKEQYTNGIHDLGRVILYGMIEEYENERNLKNANNTLSHV